MMKMKKITYKNLVHNDYDPEAIVNFMDKRGKYWAERLVKSQSNLTSKNIKETEKQLERYYSYSMNKIIGQFEKTYNHLLSSIADGREPTPADLYKLDTYWQMQAQLATELDKLGNKQAKLLSKQFMAQWNDIYNLYARSGEDAFSTIDTEMATQLINQIWCADGKSWSDRVWDNTNRLRETLNNGLVESVITGKKPTELKKQLMRDFNVSYERADSLVRTEMAHIQTQAAKKRYEEYGIKQVEVWVDEDERTCPVCAAHEGERYFTNQKMPVPFHPRCRCCMIPVIE